VENEKGAANWKDTDLGKEHYEWILDKVLIAAESKPAVSFLLDGVRMPAGFDVKEYRTFAIILSSDDAYSVNAAASNFSWAGGQKWNILNSDGVKYTDSQMFYYHDHSDVNSGASAGGCPTCPGGTPEQIKISDAQTNVHELIHTQGHIGHDKDSSCVSPYSIMTACDKGDFFTYPIYNRIYLTGWLPETAITTDPSLIQDSYNATDPTKKYLLKLGDLRYQELFNGTWYQYRIDGSIINNPDAVHGNALSMELTDNATRQALIN
jgi:hypothetical protein